MSREMTLIRASVKRNHVNQSKERGKHYEKKNEQSYET